MTNEEPGNLNDNTAAEYQSSVNLKIDVLEYHDNSGPETTVQNENIATNIRRSQRVRKQRLSIDPNQIGGCDDPKDLDYK